MRRENLTVVPEGHHFLKELSETHRGLLLGCASEASFAKGEYLLQAGEAADSFFLIREGRACVELPMGHHNPIVVRSVHENDVLGWSWLVPPYRWHFSARALEPVSALAFDGRCIRAKIEADHELGYELYRRFSLVMSARMEGALLQLVGLCG